jgi:hypothetical protein
MVAGDISYILEKYDGNDASFLVTVFQRLQGRLFDKIEQRYNGDISASILSVARALQGKLVAIEKNLSCYQVTRNEQDDDLGLNDQEPVVAPL